MSEGKRIVSLDAFRGFTVAAMIMVNFPGSAEYVFPTLRHSVWNGLTFTDTVAPFFLFIVGVSISFAYTKVVRDGGSTKKIYQKIVVRSLKIFAVGMFLNLMPHFDFSEIRWTGTLHRISVVFLVSAILFLKTTWKQQAWMGLVVLLLYWVVMLKVPVPGFGEAVLEPGRNLAAWVDSQYLPGKMWQGTWDPEGIVSTFPAIVTCITGMLAGRLLQSDKTESEKINYLMSFGVVSMIAGYFVGLSFPVNENLWTSSFVLVTSGMAMLVLGLLYFRIDVLQRKAGSAVGVIFGVNAITAYVLGDVLAMLFYGVKVSGHSVNEYSVSELTGIGISPPLASWFYAIFFVGVNFVPVYLLYRKRIFVKL